MFVHSQAFRAMRGQYVKLRFFIAGGKAHQTSAPGPDANCFFRNPIQARAAIATMSFARAKTRLTGAKRRRGSPEEASALDRQAGETLSTMKNLAINSSQFADDRPLSAIQVRGGCCGWGVCWWLVGVFVGGGGRGCLVCDGASAVVVCVGVVVGGLVLLFVGVVAAVVVVAVADDGVAGDLFRGCRQTEAPLTSSSTLVSVSVYCAYCAFNSWDHRDP